MSMNKFMHPRNIYKSPPNFKQLAINYPEFREHVQQDVTGKVTLDFKDLKALRALSRTLLKNDFGLDVEMPLSKLIPTIPLRLNYILWLEDLLTITGKTQNIRGIDIGTGASCVYPLIAAKKNNWFMLATETDTESIKYAKENIERNSLNDRITLVHIEDEKLIEKVVGNNEFDFCMCNPPFFSCTQELHPFFKARKTNRPHPKNAFCASVNEVVSKGGEVEFVLKLISESQTLNRQITVYSTMLGHKSSLPAVKKALREASVFSFKESEFCQGNTTRWGLAWTYHEIDLRKVVDPTKSIKIKPKPSLKYQIPKLDANEYSLNFVTEKLLQMFKELQMTIEEATRNKIIRRYFVTAFSNTWSHQRRKKRGKVKQTDDSLEEQDVINQNNICDNGTNAKRTAEDEMDGLTFKKLKIATETSATDTVFLKFVVTVLIESDNIFLELECKREYDDRESLHQILQYVKNNLKV